ncbi:MAG: hypothetical protein ABI567_03000 [Gammaproteobacteria bacterium]
MASHDSRWIGVQQTGAVEPWLELPWTLFLRTGTHQVDYHQTDQWDFMLFRAGDVQPLPGPGSLALVLLGLGLALRAGRLRSWGVLLW